MLQMKEPIVMAIR